MDRGSVAVDLTLTTCARSKIRLEDYRGGDRYARTLDQEEGRRPADVEIADLEHSRLRTSEGEPGP